MRFLSFVLIAFLCLPALPARAKDLPASGVYMMTQIDAADPTVREDGMFRFLETDSQWNWLEYDSATGDAMIFSPRVVKPARLHVDFATGQADGTISFLPAVFAMPLSAAQALGDDSFRLSGADPFAWTAVYSRVDPDHQDYAAAVAARARNLADTTARREERRQILQQSLDETPQAVPALTTRFADLPYLFDQPIDQLFTPTTISISNLDPEFSHDGFDLGPVASRAGDGSFMIIPWNGLTDIDKTVATYLNLTDAEASLSLNNPERSLTLYYDEVDQMQFVGQIKTDASGGLLLLSTGIGEARPDTVLRFFRSFRPDDGTDMPLPDEEVLAGSSTIVIAPDSIAHLAGVLNGPDPISALTSSPSWDVKRPVLMDQDGNSFKVELSFDVVTKEALQAQLSGEMIETRGSPETALLILRDDGECDSKIAFPIQIPDGSSDTYLTATVGDIFERTLVDGRGNCIVSWAALRAARDQLPAMINAETAPVALVKAAQYDGVTSLEAGFVRTELDGKYGLLSADGHEVLRPEFDDVTVYPSAILTRQEQGYRLFALDGTPIIDQPEQRIWPIDELPDYFAMHSRSADRVSNYGLVRTSDKAILLSNATDLRFLQDRQVFLITDADGNAAILDLDGKKIGNDRNETIWLLSDSPNYVVSDAESGLYYLTDDQLNRRPQPYSSAWRHDVPRLIFVTYPAEADDQQPDSAYIDYDGNRITPEGMTPEYEPSADGYITVHRERREIMGLLGAMQQQWGLLDRQGDVVIPLEYDQLHMEREGVVPVRKGKNFAVFAIDGTRLTDYKWGNLTLSYGGGIMARQFSDWHLIDHRGNLLDPRAFDERPLGVQIERHDTGEEVGAFVAANGGKFGLITGAGEVLVPFDYASFNASFSRFTTTDGKTLTYPSDFR